MITSQVSDISTETEFNAEQAKILKTIKKPIRKEVRMKSEGIMCMSYKYLQEATMRGECVIDKVCVLSRPLIESGPVLQALYHAQELMMDPPEEAEEELSSPAKALEQDSTAIEIGRLRLLTDEEVEQFKAQNRAYLNKVYPELLEQNS